MQKLEKILEEIDKIYVDDIGVGVDCNLQGRSDLPCDNCYECIKDACKDIIRKHMNDGWIPVEERLPEERINPVTNDFYDYQVTAKFGECIDIRHYKFGRGHWWHGPAIVDKYVIAWQPIPEPYELKEEI